MSARSSSRRRRLWELPVRAHCPVIGVCLPISVLRKIVNKALRGEVAGDDYDLHIGAVVECANRNALSEMLQKQMEQRFATTIILFAAAKTGEALWESWVKAVERGDVAGAFWAALTHPRCDEALESGLIRDMHMLQHQAGASQRADLRRMEVLQAEHAALEEEFHRLQERHARQMSEKINQVVQMNSELASLRVSIKARDGAIESLTNELSTLRDTLPDLKDRIRQQLRLNDVTQRLVDAESRTQDLESELSELKQRLSERDSKPQEEQSSPIPETMSTESAGLQDRNVLCVGGRTGNVTAYRQLIERKGGHFAYHDGGIEDSQSLLDSSLSAADMVICQTGCISHNAYWRVKDFCKRHGKQCVFVDNPSASSLARSLDEVFVMDRKSVSRLET